MDIIRQNLNDDGSYGFILGGVAVDGLYRIARASSQEAPEDWLNTHQAEAQVLIDAGEYNEEVELKKLNFEGLATKITAELDYLNTTIPTIDTMTATQVRSVVKRLALENQAMLRAWRYVVRKMT